MPRPPQLAGPAPRRLPPSLTGRLVAGLAALAVGLLLVAGLEGLLRLLGVGRAPLHDSRLAYQRLVLPALAPDERPDGTPVWRTADPRLAFRTLAREKPPELLRVVAFGGSATAGLGYSPNGSFPAYLEGMLRAALPGRPVEVLNLGIVAVSSKQVQALVAETCARYEPDALIVYSGNNEYLELHAARYAAARAGPLGGLGASLARMHLARLLRGRRGAVDGRAPDGNEEQLLRLSQAEILQEIELGEDEVRAAFDGYEQNLTRMAHAAREAGVPLVLCTVASNWRWRGRRDLPEGWLAELAGPGSDEPAALRERARGRLEERLAAAGPKERHELLHRRASLAELEGRHADAARDFRAAMNADPHLRRALDAQNERVAGVSRREGTLLLDVVELLRGTAEHGIVGFDEFYDYVHPTPRGALAIAGGLLRTLAEHGVVTPVPGFDPAAHAREALADLEARASDYPEVARFLGFGFDPGLIADRDLWKYERMLAGLDELLARDPANVLARVFRANARSFRLDGAAGAAEDYRAALLAQPDLAAAREGLDLLLAERTP